MTYLSDAMLTRMRSQVAQMLPGTCVIARNAGTVDSDTGWPVEDFQPVAGGTVRCRVDPVSSKDEIEITLNRESINIVYQLTVPWNAPIAVNDIITYDSDEYEIVQIDNQHSWNVSKRAVIGRVE